MDGSPCNDVAPTLRITLSAHTWAIHRSPSCERGGRGVDRAAPCLVPPSCSRRQQLQPAPPLLPPPRLEPPCPRACLQRSPPAVRTSTYCRRQRCVVHTHSSRRWKLDLRSPRVVRTTTSVRHTRRRDTRVHQGRGGAAGPHVCPCSQKKPQTLTVHACRLSEGRFWVRGALHVQRSVHGAVHIPPQGAALTLGFGFPAAPVESSRA